MASIRGLLSLPQPYRLARFVLMTLTLATTSITLLYLPATQAVEGMYTPSQLPEIRRELKKAGLKLNPKKLDDLTAHPMGAVVSLGGCSASFVSKNGLVATNHHCARGSVQFNSNKDNNYLEKGFVAKTLADELQAAPGSRIYVTESFEDVTVQVLANTSADMSGIARQKQIEANRKALIAECEKAAGYRCQIAAFFGGSQYQLIKRLEIKDVRIVYAPADSVGKYGGDIDNWMWPRHTGDFAFYRAYVGKNGESKEYAQDNVPYKPKHFLKVSAGGLEEGDFVMVAGYPGSTARYTRASQVDYYFGYAYPEFITLLQDWIATIEKAAPEGSDARVKYESRLAGLNNYEKNLRGQIKGAKQANLLQRRRDREARLNAWIKDNMKDASRLEELTQYDALVAESAAANKQRFWYQNVTRASMLSTAIQLYRLAVEKQLPDAEREAGYQERDLTFIRQSLEALERRYDPKVDKAQLKLFLTRYLEQDSAARIPELDVALNLPESGESISSAEIDRLLDRLYAQTALGDKATRLELMSAKRATLDQSSDSMIKLAAALYSANKRLEDAQKDREGRYALLEPKYMDAMIAYQKSQGKVTYPDANSTLRITFGNVMGAKPKDGLQYLPFTRLEGIVEKDTGEEPFNAPAKMLSLIKDRQYGPYRLKAIDSVPVNFLSDVDTTGGNSGSATLNARGELVGLLFDGTLESVNADWDMNPDITRSIHVDSRFMLWTMEYVDDAKHLIDEMEVVNLKR